MSSGNYKLRLPLYKTTNCHYLIITLQTSKLGTDRSHFDEFELICEHFSNYTVAQLSNKHRIMILFPTFGHLDMYVITIIVSLII